MLAGEGGIEACVCNVITIQLDRCEKKSSLLEKELPS